MKKKLTEVALPLDGIDTASAARSIDGSPAKERAK
jgi:hypothetical protein